LGLANGREKRIKILGDGELKRKLTVTAHAFSGSARAKIEKLGGACQLIAPAATGTPPAEAKARKPEKKPAKPA
jgi:large subunit ribosomal protein L15